MADIIDDLASTIEMRTKFAQAAGDLSGDPALPKVASTHLSSPLPVAQGGTGAATAATGLTALLTGSTVPIANGGTGASTAATGLTALLTGSTVPIANGGTGAATAGAALSALGAQAAAVASGLAVLVNGTVTVSNANITANSVIELDHGARAGTPGAVYISALNASTSFTITSTSNTDGSTVFYRIRSY